MKDRNEIVLEFPFAMLPKENLTNTTMNAPNYTTDSMVSKKNASSWPILCKELEVFRSYSDATEMSFFLSQYQTTSCTLLQIHVGSDLYNATLLKVSPPSSSWEHVCDGAWQ